ncbi:MAG TPA: SNF2-related protein, partial [Acidimicrobiales bacterium]
MGGLTEGRAVFVPGDPPRTGHLAVWPPDPDLPAGRLDKVELVLPSGSTRRRRCVPALLISVADVIAWLAGPTPPADPSLDAWLVAGRLGLQLIARGRLLPAASASGWDAWRVGPLDPADLSRLAQLSAAFPPHAHALPIAAVPKTPKSLRIRSAETLIRDFWDALADTLVRSQAAADTVTNRAFAGAEPTDVSALADWLAVADRAIDAGARAGIRLELPEGPDGEFRAILQLRSTADASLVIDAADLWDAPAAVLARMGDQADTDLFLALRRGAQVWPPLKRLLDEARPEVLVLDDPEASDLLGPAAEALSGAGIDVLWPVDVAGDGLTLRAVVQPTPSPASVAESRFGLDTLLEFRWQVALGGEVLSSDELAQIAEAKRPLVRIRGQWVTVDPALLARLRRGRTRRLNPTEALAATLAGEIDIDGERIAFDAVGPLADLAVRVQRVSGANQTAEPPVALVAKLRPYQQRGLAWLTEMAELGVGGCLADDMGLGKTVQVIALHLARWSGRPTLVVCPTSLLGNWERELHRFAPSIPVRRFHGGERHLDDLDPNEVVLATYGVVRRDRLELAGVGWGLVIADEAQHAKNPLSRTARSLRAVPAGARIALTGTPVENRLTELWSILDWTTPGLLGPLESFRGQVATPIERYGD